MDSNLTPDTYVIPFGRWKGVRATDVAEIFVVKGDEDIPVGLNYLKSLAQKDWFKYAYLLNSIIKDTEDAMCKQDVIKNDIKKKNKKKIESKSEPKKIIYDTTIDFSE